ncbi:MAG: threonylcarbamoyl-AMP synthase [Candidatus Kerfeldbacteria bacterium RIFCSPHIGHO2_02_FULL_42_14]|uniref:L-threonylcarbamoyladenylate synthase n=1 Tax=Candidatus Kerfeldbacteria bacterium RIFCSPHIGHO2_02_FULL_42_14 TaxID=1798540 RepID=A0A1G2API6_9BACT|nr:MAG: threonylcarbamoyl-AMP synthase [Candidatus Kerfeldbacteria bacterium RIFCSPHIGHO2_02_FULL_42_14]OGY81801.1 MAG: threonylcarbamoyl-AMP synthase [Candidatus Kerfeldbacteria bacterium RIFCSPHIGHO2_12_FULL_42_13]OGY84490.1 MAG: threonylcarbamoyl-AMP synthase [Candidatus Kerfeldbacteria bacterium RIFCSPLOWO2_02_FULL_42_19]OGY87970.1 MAG: threonylcarbamoyl-AMP synthase [Candidatus Kerfeldbacteria bacterium RIFCSPLOWO2_12_FULL_43_9]
MKILTVTLSKIANKALTEAVSILQKGGVVIYPTETAYALGADATNIRAIEKIKKIKTRPRGKPLALIVANFAMAKKYGFFDARARSFAKKFWPGPVTLIVKRTSALPKEVAGIYIGMRMSELAWAQKLTKHLGKPIISTSANRSGASTLYSARRARKEFQVAPMQPDLMLDAGTLPKRKPSAIVHLGFKNIRILRKGTIKVF